MAAGPHVYITIPVHNGAEHVGAAVASALAQEYDPLTVFVVDNASTDATPKVLHSFDDRRLVIERSEEFLPLADNWARALRETRGDLVLIMSADNEMAPGAVSALVSKLEREPGCGMAIGRVRHVVTPGHRRISLDPTHELSPGVIYDLERYLLSRGYNFSINAVMFRRSLQGLYFDGKAGYGCDIDLLLRLGTAGVRAVCTDEIIHEWLDHPDTVSTKLYDDVWEAIISVYATATPRPSRLREYQNRIGRMLTWECMLHLRRGNKELARKYVEKFGAKTSASWRLLLEVQLAIPGAHRVPSLIRKFAKRYGS